MPKVKQGEYEITKFGDLEVIIKREDVGYVVDIYDNNGMLHSTATIWDDDMENTDEEDDYKQVTKPDDTEVFPPWCKQGEFIYDKKHSQYGMIGEVRDGVCGYNTSTGGSYTLTASEFSQHCVKVWDEWTEVGEYCYDVNEDAYARIVVKAPDKLVLHYVNGAWRDSQISRSVQYCDDCVCRAQRIPFGDFQLIDLVGKTLHRAYEDGEAVHHLVTDCENHCFEDDMDAYYIKMNGDWYGSDEIMDWYCGDHPCCNFKYYDENKKAWVEHEISGTGR